MDNSKEFKLDTPEIEATIHYLATSEGGRKSAIFSGYRGTFYYDGKYNSAAQEFIGQVTCDPGNTVRTLMCFAAPEVQIGRLYPGLKFKITEGSRVVGLGEIVSILRPDLIKQ